MRKWVRMSSTALVVATLFGVAVPAWAASTTRVSVGPGGVQGNGESFQPALSAGGRFVAFYSGASNLVPGDTNNMPDVFLRDRQTGTTERISVARSGAQELPAGDHGRWQPGGLRVGREQSYRGRQ